MNDLLEQIRKVVKTLPQAQKLVAEYVLLNYNKIPFLTIINMAIEINVSDSTIINLCNVLGFDSFSSFKKVFIEYAQSELAIYNNFEDRIANLIKDDSLSNVKELDKVNIENTLTHSTNIENIKPFLEMLDKASNIYVCGMRTSSMFMDFFAQCLRIQGYNIVPFAYNEHFTDQLWQIKEDDLFISFSFSKYTTKLVKALDFLSKRSIPCVSFTDSTLSPTYRLADLSFKCDTKSYSYQASYVGVLSLLNVIITEISIKYKDRTIQNLKDLDKTLEYFDTFTVDTQI